MCNKILTNKSITSSWKEKSKEIAILAAITKQEVIDFVNGPTYKNNYVAVYKEQTEEKLARQNFAKPAITPLDIPKENQCLAYALVRNR